MRTPDHRRETPRRPRPRPFFAAALGFTLIAGERAAQPQQLITTYYATFGAQTPNSPGYDSGGRAFAEYWLSSTSIYVLSSASESLSVEEILGDAGGQSCLGAYEYRPGEGALAPCSLRWGAPQFVKAKHGQGLVIDSQVIRYRVGACPAQAGLPQGFSSVPTYRRLFLANERSVAGPIELQTQQFPGECATANQVYDRRINITLANYSPVSATFELIAYPFHPWHRENEPVWTSTVELGARSVTQVNNLQIPRALTEPGDNRHLGSMSVWLTVTSDQPYLGYVSSVFEGGEPGSLPFQVFALRGQAGGSNPP